MTRRVVVLGSGYGGVAAVQSLEDELADSNTELVWISKEDYHLLLHETHRCIRNPDARESVTIPVSEINSSGTQFVQATVTDIDVDSRTVKFDEHDDIGYDYAVVAVGSRTAFYGIDGLEEHGLTMKSLGDALAINEHLARAAREASRSDPAQIVIGGGGLTGIQVAGEVAAWRNDHGAHADVHLVERSPEIFPGHDNEFQGAIQNHLENHDVELDTGSAMTAVDDEKIAFDERDSMNYDVLVWAGGVTGQDALESADIDKNHNRAYAQGTLETSDDRVFAVGDSALVHQDTDPESDEEPLTEEALWETIADDDLADVPPPTAEAAWEEGGHIGGNVARAIAGEEREHWAYMNKGTAVSIGDKAVVHGVIGIPLDTFSGLGARIIEKGISVRWIESITSWRRAVRSWSNM